MIVHIQIASQYLNIGLIFLRALWKQNIAILKKIVEASCWKNSVVEINTFANALMFTLCEPKDMSFGE